ncbi:MAG: hypothetical protein R2856_33660 [Caldilineaceae bacterium]
MPTLLFKDTGLVKAKASISWRRIGTAMQSIKVFNMRAGRRTRLPRYHGHATGTFAGFRHRRRSGR